jgi:hypothetical protein
MMAWMQSRHCARRVGCKPPDPHMQTNTYRSDELMRLNEALAVAGRCAIDCATLRELKEAIQKLRAHSRNSVLADLGEERITDIEILRKELGLEPCAS